MQSYFQNGQPTNTRLKWWPSDTEEFYDRNLKTNREKLEDLGWTKDNISYMFDNYGFRNDYNFNTSDYYNLVLGCSHTFGIGVNETDIWYNVLKERFNEPFYNAAVPGGSIGCCYRSLDGLIDKGMKVKRVFMFTPGKNRHETYNGNLGDPKTGRWDPVTVHSQPSLHLRKIKLNENELYKHYRTNLLSIRYICKENNIELVDIMTDGDETTTQCVYNSKEARDLEHPGIAAHKLIGEIFYDEYCNRYGSKS